MNRFIRPIGLCSIGILWCGNAMAQFPVVQFCEVTATGVFGTGEVFDGTASDTIAGGLSIDWMHNATGVSFETTATDPDPDGIECRLNGATTADLDGTGTATFNGMLNHSYSIAIEDNRPPPNSLVLVASITFHPTRRNEGTADFATPRTVVVPAEINVLAGGSGSGWTRLHLDDFTCRYRGTGVTYGFVRCTDPLDSGIVAGDSLDISHARLRIQQADRSFVVTVVEAEIGTGEPAAGRPDRYSIVVADPGGTIVYSFDDNVVDGDISIELLGNKFP